LIGRSFAIVIAISLIMLVGGLSILSMPIEQYPTIAPPSIQISATYPGPPHKPSKTRWCR